jgi:hypothetical protein
LRRIWKISAAVAVLGIVLLFDPLDLIEVVGSEPGHPRLDFAVPSDGSRVVVAVGDIADCERASLWNEVVSVFDGRLAWAGISETLPRSALDIAAMIERQPGIVLALGDLAYPEGEPEDFRSCFGPIWHRLVPRTYPVPGNHEYRTDATGYRRYWGARAGPDADLFYGVDYAGWHIVALNSEVSAAAGSRQAEWLEADLQQHSGECILALDHRPAFSSVVRSQHENAAALFDILYRHRATLLLSGHNHFYERTAPIDPRGERDDNGIRQFVVGTGGETRSFSGPAASFSEVLIGAQPGALRLTLNDGGYEWAFLRAPDGSVADQGQASCTNLAKAEDMAAHATNLHRIAAH